LFLAMAYHRLGQKGEARKSLDQATAFTLALPKGPGRWAERTQLEFLQDEAEKLIRGKNNKPKQQAGRRTRRRHSADHVEGPLAGKSVILPHRSPLNIAQDGTAAPRSSQTKCCPLTGPPGLPARYDHARPGPFRLVERGGMTERKYVIVCSDGTS